MSAHVSSDSDAPTLLTVGHSTRSIGEFLDLLAAHGTGRVVDVRRFPGSARHPHFGREALAHALAERGIEYAHEEALGGRRAVAAEAAARSPNRTWRNASFRAYADHMGTPPFQDALARVLEGGLGTRTAVMCAEAVPWRCHRQLIADAAVARGWGVLHVLAPDRAQPHALNPAARVGAHGAVTYPLPGDPQSELL
jgi:uncharacterized protein (DUF488 family)